MSTMIKKTAGGVKFNIERYDSALKVADNCRKRKMTSDRFHDMQNEPITSWHGVKSYDEAISFLRNGYQPVVDSMRGVFKLNKMGESSRFSFSNEIQGFAPVVPLALKGVPNSMVNMTMKPIKAKVIDVYYDMTASCGVDSDKIIEAGKTLLSTIIEFERQGYRFNLYSMQTYSDSRECDMLVVKVKDAKQPIDLKRISFAIAHTGFFRVIGFDWYSKVPNGKYRSAYGMALSYNLEGNKYKNTMKELFGKNTVSFSAVNIIKGGKDYIVQEMKNNGDKN